MGETSSGQLRALSTAVACMPETPILQPNSPFLVTGSVMANSSPWLHFIDFRVNFSSVSQFEIGVEASPETERPSNCRLWLWTSGVKRTSSASVDVRGQKFAKCCEPPTCS